MWWFRALSATRSGARILDYRARIGRLQGFVRSGRGDPQATLDGYRIGLLVPVGGALLALAITLPGLRARLAAT